MNEKHWVGFGFNNILADFITDRFRAKLPAQELLDISSSFKHFLQSLLILAEDVADTFHGGLVPLVLVKFGIELGCFLPLQPLGVALVVDLLGDPPLLIPKSCESNLLPQTAASILQDLEELVLYCFHLLDNIFFGGVVLINAFGDPLQANDWAFIVLFSAGRALLLATE